MSIINNNEAIGVLALHSLVNKAEKLSLANCFIALPLLFDKKIRNYLKRKTTNILSAQQLITDKYGIFVGFSEKFNDCLLTTTNSIVMGKEMGLFSLEGNFLVSSRLYNLESTVRAKKLNEVEDASTNAIQLLTESPEELYSLLRIKL